ncbi:hypothetical protein GCM10010286_30860 [Streptomyces toxytricini]|nr:hypothetical protein GCM10010286_30860 [Streptomyces toxytricini]
MVIGTWSTTTRTVLATKIAADHTGEACSCVSRINGEGDLRDVEAEDVHRVGGEKGAHAGRVSVRGRR